VAVNGLWTSGVFVANALVMFFLSPVVVSTLGDVSYGIWAIVLSLTGYFGFADLGVRPAVVYYVAHHDALGEHEEVNRYANSAFVAFAAFGLVLFALAAVAAPYVPTWFREIPAARARDATYATLVMGLTFALTLPLNAFSAVVVGKQRYQLLVTVDLCVLGVKAAATLLVLRAGGGLVGLALVGLGVDLLEMGGKTLAAFRIEPTLRFAPGLVTRARVRNLLGYGGRATVVSLALLLIWRTDAIVIGAMISASAAGRFAVGANLPFYARAFATAAGRVLTPAASGLAARGDTPGLRAMLVRGSRSMLLVSGAMLVYLLVAGQPFLARWQGEAYRGDSSMVLLVLTLGAIGPIAGYPFEAVLYGTNRLKALALLSIAEGVGNLALSIALAIPFGIVGVALGTAIPSILVRLVALPLYAARAFEGRFALMARRAWIVPLAAAAATLALLRLVVAPSDTLSWPALLGLAAASQVVFLALYAVLARWAPPALRLEGAEASA
jgi:O-antigen/teichoic acid export membrane protein